jgi:hypothetical protein
MTIAPKQSKANQIWFVTFALVILALAIETQPHGKGKSQTASQAGKQQASAQKSSDLPR